LDQTTQLISGTLMQRFNAEYETFLNGGEDVSRSVPLLQGDYEEEDDKILRTVDLIRPPSAKSWYWKYFGLYPSTVNGKKDYAVCNICREEYKYNLDVIPKKWEIKYGSSKSSSKLEQHLMAKHRLIWNEESTRKSLGDTKQPKIFSSFPQQSKINVTAREKMLRLIVEEDLPLEITESLWFRDFVEALDPNYQHEDLKELTARVALQAEIVQNLIKEQIRNKKISITADCWTSSAKESYLSLTCHFVDNTWNLKTFVLACDSFPSPHRPEDFAAKVTTLLEKMEVQVGSLRRLCLISFNRTT
jgi:hypothetical protein